MFFRREKPTYAVIGLGRFGSAVATTLLQYDQNVIVIDRDPERIKHFRELTDFAYIMKTLDQEAFEEVGIGEVDTAIICIGENLEANMLATLYCLNLKVPNIIAKANSLDQGTLLQRLGVMVEYPERDSGVTLGHRLMNQEVVDYFRITSSLDLAQLPIPSYFIGRKLVDLQLRQRWGINVIAIKTLNSTIENIDPNYVFKKEDSIIAIGSRENIRRFEDAIPE